MTMTLSGTNGVTTPASVNFNNVPAFSAWQNSSQSLTNSTPTIIQFQSVEFDTNSNYNNSTYRFTPTVAGYYQFNACVNVTSSGNYLTTFLTSIYKNGSEYKRGSQSNNAVSPFSNQACNVSALIYMNGTTDYVEAYAVAFFSTGTTNTNAYQFTTYFQGSLVRSA